MDTPQQDEYTLAKVSALLAVYIANWDAKWRGKFEILDVEHEFTFPLLNPESQGQSRTFVEAGKMDVLAREKETGRIVVIEHKTTSDSVEPDSDYWDRLRMDTQCSKYFLAALHTGQDVAGIIYDVIRKPMQRPSLIPLLDDDCRKIVLDQQGNRVFCKDGKKPRETGDAEKGWVVQCRIETPAEFAARITTILHESAADYFAHREVPRLNSDLTEYMDDAWAMSQQILYHRQKSLWPRNPQACSQYGTCEYFDLCCGRASVDGVRFGTRTVANPELTAQTAGGGLEMLTASRATAFRKCHRFYRLKYEDKIDRLDNEGKEALRFGTLMHQGLERYFNSLKPQTQNQ